MGTVRATRDNRRDNRSRARLGAADYSPTGANPWARHHFVRAVQYCVPQAFEALAAIATSGTNAAHETALAAWAAEWGFGDDWLLDCARQIVIRWDGTPDPNVLAFSVNGDGFWAPMVPAPIWDSTKQTEADYRATIEAYIAEVKALPGFTPTPQKEVGSRHFEWIALHHVGRWTYQQIVHRYQNADGNPNVPAISQGIRDVAGLIGLTLRPSRGRKLHR